MGFLCHGPYFNFNAGKGAVMGSLQDSIIATSLFEFVLNCG